MTEKEVEKVKFQNNRFGELTIALSDCLEFSNGIPGFERCKGFGLIEVEDESPFLRLLSLDQPQLGFVVLNPLLIWQDYDPNVGREELVQLGIERIEQLAIYCIVTMSEDPGKVTVNLQGPIYLNVDTMQAKQMILVDDRYGTKHPLIENNDG
ncbi:MAG: flagellar assembly protein FliW [Candidatus Latescibacterota bacterium]|nr:flagellar assembly protein FliW [Candidatus Latescibacterota bacterium]